MTDRTRASVPDVFVYLIFMASGASALIYQVIWARWLGLVFGNTTTSVSVILASFMFGLAFGSFVVGRRLHRVGNPMTLYAYLELAIGFFALGFPLLSSLIDAGYSHLVDADSGMVRSLITRTSLAFLLLVVPTTFMGATLPLLTEFFRRSPRYSDGWKVGFLYAANTAGAALGVIVASFFLIELVGVQSTTRIAASLNLLVALVAINLARTSNLPAIAPGIRATVVIPGSNASCALVVLAVSGGIAMASEVMWTRALEVLIGSSTYAFATILVVYLVGIALGSWLMSKLVTRVESLSRWLAATQIGMGAWTIMAIACFFWLGEYIAQFSQAPISIPRVLAFYGSAASLLLPLAVLSGAAFPIATRMLQPDEPDAAGVLVARAYAWNTIGAVVGTLVAGFVIAATLDYFQSIYLLALCYGLTGAAVLLVARAEGRSMPVNAAMVITMAVSVWLTAQVFQDSRFAARVAQKTGGEVTVAYHEPGIQGVTSVLRRRGDDLGSILLVNGAGMTLKATDTKMMSHLPMLLHPEPRHTLVICFGMGTTYRSAISHGFEVTAVELVQEVIEAFPYFHEDAHEVLSNGRGRIVVNDGRNFLKATTRRFDVITVDPPPPIDGRGVTNLHSIEFLELAKLRLKPGGLVAHWIPFPWVHAGVDDWPTFWMLVDTFRASFPHAVMVRGLNNFGLHVVGSMQPIDTTPEMIRQRLARGNVAKDLHEWQTVPDGYFASLEPVPVTPADEVLLLTDDRPHLEFNLLRHLSTKTVEHFPTVFW